MKRSIRILLLIFMVLFVSMSLIQAGGVVEDKSSIDGRLYFLAKSTVNNRNKAMRLDLTSVYSTSNASSVGLVDTWNPSTPDQALFRLSSTLYSNDQTTTPLYVKITSNNDWKFIYEDNPSYTRPFGINAFSYTNSFTDKYSGFGGYGDAALVQNSSNNPSYYLFNIPYGTKKSGTGYGVWNMNYVVPSILTDIDFCVTLPAYDGDLPDGYYYTDLHYEITNSSGVSASYQEHKTTVGRNQAELTTDGAKKALSGEIRVWGYVGQEEGGGSSQYAFNISEATYTYNVDLKQDDYFDVALVSFRLDDTVNSDPASSESTNKQKYIIYISPGTTYNYSNYSALDYNFKKLDTENISPRDDTNTVYYELFKDKQGTKFASTDYPNVYKITPTYTTQKLSNYEQEGSDRDKRWILTWKLENQPVYLKVTDDSLAEEHLKGLYTTYLYFTLVVK